MSFVRYRWPRKWAYTLSHGSVALVEASGKVDHCIFVPSDETPRIQECHILVDRIIAELVEEALFGAQSCILGP